MVIELEGQIERITFTNDENGYTVARVRLKDGESATVVGVLHQASPGSYLRMRGEWSVHPKFGSQFKLQEYETVSPRSTETIEKYLAAGAVKGIGPATAKTIVERFGAQSLEIMDRDIGRLREIPGIGRKRLDAIKQAWEGQREVRDVMLFLQGNGVSPAYAARIYRRYGKGSVAVVKKNPYRLASDIDGIGFTTADRIAETLGYPRDSEERAQAGLEYLLQRCVEEGHLYLPAGALLRRAGELLGIEEAVLRDELGVLERRRRIVVDRLAEAAASRVSSEIYSEQTPVYPPRSSPAEAGRDRSSGGAGASIGGDGIDEQTPVYPPRSSPAEAGRGRSSGGSSASTGGDGIDEQTPVYPPRSSPAEAGRDRSSGGAGASIGGDGIDEQTPVYPPRLYECERAVARRLRELIAREDAAGSEPELLPPPRRMSPRRVAELLERLSSRLGRDQRAAVRAAYENGVAVITGGPGTGKTTIVDALAKGFGEAGLGVLLAAPTGRAAKRLSEATGREAKTIHRLLEAGPGGAFRRDKENPLDCDVLIVDEISMVDVPLMANLLAALPDRSRLVMVGDADQLPSVGPGNLLGDVIDSRVIPVARLTEVYRQQSGSRIISGAYDIIRGERPRFATDEEGDFYFIEQDDPDRVVGIVTALVRERIPARFHFEPMEEVQVLTPMNRGPAGTIKLNESLQEALNPSVTEMSRGARTFRVGDKVMQLRNNYDLDVFNGDIGRVRRVDPETNELRVVFDGREIVYEAENLDELTLAYAVTVHKAQGSEFPAVVIPLLTQHFVLLQRNLLYTAVTRGKRLVVIVGSSKALSLAIRNDRTQKRNTQLARRLQAAEGVKR